VLPEGGDNAEDMQLYVNGIRETGVVTPGPINTKANISFRIGTDDNGYYFAGLIDDVRVYDWALTADQIIDAADFPLVFAGMDKLASLPAGNRVSIEGRLFLDWVGASVLWEQIRGPEGVVIADPTVLSTEIEFSHEGDYAFRLTAIQGSNALSDEMNITVIDGEVGFWKFDGNLQDVLGHPGTAAGDPAFVGAEQAKVGSGAVDLDGNDGVLINGFTGIAGTGARTCMAWIKTTATIAPIVYWGDMFMTGGNWEMRINSQGQLRVQAAGGGGVNSVTKVNTGQWVHVAAVLPEGGNNADDVLLYVNGVLETGGVVSAGAINTVVKGPLRIGTDDMAHYFTGLIDDVRVYDRALTAEEIAAVMGN
jgi:hypothetical protein